jgi:hypothetical protein
MPTSERPDDIMTTPGGPQYRANVHQEGIKNPWPPIAVSEIVLDANVHVTYRAYIETKSGEARNNIIYINVPGQEYISSLKLSAINLPAGIEAKEGEPYHRPKIIAQVLVIEISQDVKPGEYAFEIGIEIDGKGYGKVPCTIKVL